MTENSGGGGTGKLQDPKVMAKLSKMWSPHETDTVKRNESVEALRSRNTAIRLSKGLAPRRPDGGVVKEEVGRKFKIQRFDDFDCIRFNLIYPADFKPGQPDVHYKSFWVSVIGAVNIDDFIEKSLEEARAKFNEELDK